MGILFFILFATILVITILVSTNNPGDKKVQYNEPTKPVKPQKQRIKKVKSVRKWQKKMQHKAGKKAMEKVDFVYLTIEESNAIFQYNSSSDEIKLLDIMLEAKLEGIDIIKVDRNLYNRLVLKKTSTND